MRQILSRVVLAIAFLMAVVVCSDAQRSNTFYVNQFEGRTVGEKIAAAQNSCAPGYPCFIVIDSDLAVYAEGTLPAECALCSRLDFRGGMPPMRVTQAGTFDQSRMHDYAQSLIGGCDPSVEWNATQGTYATEGITGCVKAPVTSIAESNAVAGYAAGYSGAPVVGGFFQGRALANDTRAWGINAVVQDIPGITPVTLLGIDVNVNPQNVPAVYAAGMGGINIALAAPNAGVYGSAVTCQGFGANPGTWNNCFLSADKKTDQALIVGVHTGANPQGSQVIYFHHQDAGDVVRTSVLSTDSSGNFVAAPYGGTFKITGGLDTTGAILRSSGGIAATVSDGAAVRSGTAAGNFYLDVGTLNIRDGNGNTSGGSLIVAKTLTVNGGVTPDGAGIKHKRVAGCATAASLAAVCTTAVTWGTTFADANYTVTCSGDLVTSGVPINGGFSAKAAGSVTFRTVSATAAAAQYTTIDCVAVHD